MKDGRGEQVFQLIVAVDNFRYHRSCVEQVTSFSMTVSFELNDHVTCWTVSTMLNSVDRLDIHKANSGHLWTCR